jgi:hypothetical protein
MSERRRQYYTDRKIQGYLLMALVVIESLLLVGMLYLLYSEINAVIDAHLFRIHPPHEGAWPDLLHVLARVVGLFLVVNVLVLIAMHLVWSRYIRNTVRHFSMVLEKLVKQDFAPLNESNLRIHPVARLAELWFEKERAREQRLIRLRQRLSEPDDLGSDELVRVIAEYRGLLEKG